MPLSLLDKPLLYVTGKGGVGKTTVAASLGVAAAQRGRTTLVCEVADQDRVSRSFAPGGEPALGDGEVQLDENLWALSIDPEEALEEWLGRQLGSTAMVAVLAKSQAFQYFIAAAPGARELITIGKIWDLAQGTNGGRRQRVYDTIVVDAPASGHGVAMLRTPQTFAEIARVGPVRRQAEKVFHWLKDPARTGYVAVALPEEMPVNETIELERGIAEAVGLDLDAVIVNAVLPQRLDEEDVSRLTSALVDGGLTAQARQAVGVALGEDGRVRKQGEQIERLRERVTVPLVTLPQLPEPNLDVQTYRRLAADLDRALGR